MKQEINQAGRQSAEVARRQVFNNPQFGELRVAGTADKPMFCLADVCKALDINNSRDVRKRLDTKGVDSTDTLTEGGMQQLTFIDEPNLYRCIFQSRKKEAKAFQDWVFGEVLPAIRKQGGYMVAKSEETPEETMARALQIANDTLRRQQDRILAFQKTVAKQSLLIAEKDKKVGELSSLNEERLTQISKLTPDAEYTREVMTSRNTWNTNLIAKEFGMSAVTLNQHLKQLGIQYKQHNCWCLSTRYQNKDYTKMATFKYLQSDGTVGTRLQMEWTEKGRRWLHELHKKGKF